MFGALLWLVHSVAAAPIVCPTLDEAAVPAAALRRAYTDVNNALEADGLPMGVDLDAFFVGDYAVTWYLGRGSSETILIYPENDGWNYEFLVDDIAWLDEPFPSEGGPVNVPPAVMQCLARLIIEASL